MDIAEIVKLGPKERRAYEDSLKHYRDFKNALTTQFDEGKIEGKIETAINLFKLGAPLEMIIKATHFEKDELMKILKEKGHID